MCKSCQNCHRKRKCPLQDICAGVWHNAVLCALCWVCALLLPLLLAPLYSNGNGATVRWACSAFARMCFSFAVSFFFATLVDPPRVVGVSKGSSMCRGVPEGSPLSSQLEAGDSIWLLNDCPVTSSHSWLACLASSRKHETPQSPHKTRSVPDSLAGRSTIVVGVW